MVNAHSYFYSLLTYLFANVFKFKWKEKPVPGFITLQQRKVVKKETPEAETVATTS